MPADRPRVGNRRSDGSFSIGTNVWPGTSKLIEEMGEVMQVLGKLIATHGATDHWDGTDLRDRLHEELSDLIAATSFFVDANGLDLKRLDARVAEKVALFEQWHAEQGVA